MQDRLKIMAIDDSGTTLRTIKRILDKNYDVVLASSGQRAIKLLDENAPDLILLDIMMPDMDGFETYKAIREHEKSAKHSPAPVIFLTGENDSDTERRGLKIGAADFIQKPFNEDVLIKRIQNTIDNAKTIENLTKEAVIDGLTGFFNKAAGTAQISELCKNSKGTLAIIDLDNFKLVNDLYGHEMGDKILITFSSIIRKSLRETDVVSRIGGDEFLLFLRRLQDESSLSMLFKRISRQLSGASETLMGPDNGIPLGISLGAVIVPLHGRQYESLFAMADNALYRVKQNGKHGYAIYEYPDESDEITEDLDYEIDKLTKIVEERNEKEGALLLGREAFSINYRFIMRFYKRYGGKAVKILFSIHLKDNENQDMQETVSQFGLMLQKTLRRSDLILQSKSNQFFILLTERNGFEIENVLNRLIQTWNDTPFGKNSRIQYSVKKEDYQKNKLKSV